MWTGLLILSRLPGASMGDTSLWQGVPTVEGGLMILTFLKNGLNLSLVDRIVFTEYTFEFEGLLR